MKRKFLDDIGYTERWDKLRYKGKAAAKYKEQRKEWGFDARETFSLNWAFYEWLYERLIVYRDVGGKVVNLSYHKFEYNGQEYTQLELINKLIEELKWALTDEEADVTIENYNRLMEIGKMWAIILPAMWW